MLLTLGHFNQLLALPISIDTKIAVMKGKEVSHKMFYSTQQDLQ